MQRRELLKSLAASSLVGAGNLHSLSFAAQPTHPLVVVFLRGGADSLQIAAPVEDRDYIAARPPELRILSSGTTPGVRLPKGFAAELDCRIHPSAAPLLDLFQSGHAQLLHACGLKHATRSHFVAQEILEARTSSANERILSSTSGWLTPYIKANAEKPSTLPFVATSAGQIRSLQGMRSGLSLTGELRWGINLTGEAQAKSVLESLYAGPSTSDPLMQCAQDTLRQLALIESKVPKTGNAIAAYTPGKDVKYNTENYEWQHAMQTVAQLIRMDIGLQVACVDFGGWDTHEYQPGRINNLVRQWASNVRALFDDIQAAGKDVTIVVMSEFGRRLRSNASNGTDHGHAGALWTIDSRKRKLLPETQWPGLKNEQLDQGLDLQSTVDIKQVLETVAKQTLLG